MAVAASSSTEESAGGELATAVVLPWDTFNVTFDSLIGLA